MGNTCQQMDLSQMDLSQMDLSQMNLPPKVKAFLRTAKALADDGDTESAIKYCEKAKLHCNTDTKFIDDWISNMKETSSSNVYIQIQPKKTRDSYNQFNNKLLHLSEQLNDSKIPEASDTLKSMLNETKFQTIENVQTFFKTLMDIVSDTAAFQVYDPEQIHHSKEHILLLVRNIAFVSFQCSEEIGSKMDTQAQIDYEHYLDMHEKHFKAQEGKVLSYTMLLFQLSYVRDILKVMVTTESFHEKFCIGKTAKSIAVDCITLNFSGAVEHALKGAGKGILKYAKEKVKRRGAKRNVDCLVKYKALAKLAVLHQHDSTNAYFNAFCKVINDSYKNNKYNWKIYIQLLNDLYDVVENTNDPKKRLILLCGDGSTSSIGLKHFSSFAKISTFFDYFVEDFNCRIRETALKVAEKLWNKYENDLQLKVAVQTMFLGRSEVEASEHSLVQRLLKSGKANEIMMYDFDDEAIKHNIQTSAAALVEDFSKDISDDLTNLLEVQKDNAGRSKRKQFGKTQQQILELSVANIQNQLTNVAKASSTSTNKRVKVQANRILGDEAYATGDYRNAITLYLKWKEDVVEMNDGNESCADLMSVFVKLGDVYEMQGEYETSMEYLKKALPMQVNEFGTEEHADVGETYRKMGKTCSRMGTYDQAMEYCMKSLKIRLKVLDEGHVDVGDSYHYIGSVCDDQGKYEEALDYYNKALTIHINKQGEDHPDVADTYNNIAIVYYSQGKYEEALDYYNKALTIYINKLGEDHPHTKLTQNNIRICKNRM
eukprot:g5111.t1